MLSPNERNIYGAPYCVWVCLCVFKEIESKNVRIQSIMNEEKRPLVF